MSSSKRHSEHGKKALLPWVSPSRHKHGQSGRRRRHRFKAKEAGAPTSRGAAIVRDYPRAPSNPALVMSLWALGLGGGGMAAYFWLADLADAQDWPESITNFTTLALILIVVVGLGFVGLFFWRERLRYQAEHRRWEKTVTKLEKTERQHAQTRAQAWHRVKEELGVLEQSGHRRKRVRSVQDLEIDWLEFEQLAAKTFERLGYSVTALSKQGQDGLDWQVTDAEGRVEAVLCRFWQAPMDETDVKHWLEMAKVLGGQHLYLWSLKGFTQPAWNEWEQSEVVSLCDVETMDALIERAFG